MAIDKRNKKDAGKSKKHYFMLPIGDWSKDGHGKCDWHLIESNMPLNDVFKAYFAAKEKLPEEICPANFCNEYGEGSGISAEKYQKLVDAGCSSNYFQFMDWSDSGEYSIEKLENIVLWFIMQGNDKLKLKIVNKDYAFINWCLPKNLNSNGLDSFGYGLFE